MLHKVDLKGRAVAFRGISRVTLHDSFCDNFYYAASALYPDVCTVCRWVTAQV